MKRLIGFVFTMIMVLLLVACGGEEGVPSTEQTERATSTEQTSAGEETTAENPNTPDVEQLKSDFIAEALDSEEYSITSFVIDAQTDGSDDIYKAIVDVTYNNGSVEYVEKYHFTYDKYDRWVLKEIDAYKEESWTKKPLVAPGIEEFEKECRKELINYRFFTEQDTFTALPEKTEVNLDEGLAIFVFAVETESKIRNISGEIVFEVNFDYDRGKWDLDIVWYGRDDSYVEEHNLKQEWLGKGINAGGLGEVEISLVITEFDLNFRGEENAAGILTYQGKEIPVTGEIFTMIKDCYSIILRNASEKICIEGEIDFDGNFSGHVNTAFDATLELQYYRPQYWFDIELFVKE